MSPTVKQAIQDVWQFAADGQLNRFTLTPWLDHGGWFGMYRLGEQIPDFILNRVKTLDCGARIYEGKINSPWVRQEVKEKTYTIVDPEFFFRKVDDLIAQTPILKTPLTVEEHQEFLRYINGLFPEDVIGECRIPKYDYVRRK